jgi:hypothetical protein
MPQQNEQDRGGHSEVEPLLDHALVNEYALNLLYRALGGVIVGQGFTLWSGWVWALHWPPLKRWATAPTGRGARAACRCANE